MNVFQWGFGALLAGTVAYTVWGYPRKYGAMSGKSRLFRTVGIVLANLFLLTVLLYFSTDWNAMQYRIGVPSQDSARLVKASQLLYGVTWVMLSILLVGIAALDSLENFTVYRKIRREAVEEMIRDAVAAGQAKRAALAGNSGDTGGGDGAPS